MTSLERPCHTSDSCSSQLATQSTAMQHTQGSTAAVAECWVQVVSLKQQTLHGSSQSRSDTSTPNQILTLAEVRHDCGVAASQQHGQHQPGRLPGVSSSQCSSQGAPGSRGGLGDGVCYVVRHGIAVTQVAGPAGGDTTHTRQQEQQKRTLKWLPLAQLQHCAAARSLAWCRPTRVSRLPDSTVQHCTANKSIGWCCR